MRFIDRDVVAVAIESVDQEIVLGHKSVTSNGAYSGLWVLPGGVIEKPQSIYMAAREEVFEETGADLDEFEVRLIDDDKQGTSLVTLQSGEVVQYRMKFFRFHATTERLAEEVTISPNDELDEIKWVKIEELGKYDHCPPSLELFSKLGYLAVV